MAYEGKIDSRRRQRRVMHGKLKVCLLEIRTAAGYITADMDDATEAEIRQSLEDCREKLASVIRGLGIRTVMTTKDGSRGFPLEKAGK